MSWLLDIAQAQDSPASRPLIPTGLKMDDIKLESQEKWTSGTTVSPDKTATLSKDEQYLANLGYKQGEVAVRRSRALSSQPKMDRLR